MAASAGTVTLELDANSVKLIQGLKKAQSQTKKTAFKMDKEMSAAFKSIAKSATVMTGAIIAATKVSVEFADKIAENSRAVGLTAEQYQEYSFAAKRGGVETSQFASNMTAFVKRVGEAKAGMGPLVSGLKNLNPVLLENLKNSQNQSDAFKLIAEAIKNSKSATERAAIANAAFSRAGIDMVNMLSDGSAGLDSMAQKARDLGVILDDSLIAKAERADDTFGDLQEVLKISVATTVLENADSIVTLANSLITFVGVVGKATKGWNDWLSAQGVGVKSIEEIRTRGDALLRQRLILEAKLKKIQGNSNYNIGEQKLVQGQINDIIKEQIDLQNQAIALQKGANVPKTKKDEPSGAIVIDPPGVQTEADKVAGIIASMMNDIKTFGMTDDQKALINLVDIGATEEDIALFTHASNELRLLTSNQAAAQTAANAAAADRNQMEQEYAALLAGTLSASDMHHAAVIRVDQLYAQGLIPSAEQYLAILESINQKFEESQVKVGDTQTQMTEFSVQAARNMESAFADFLFNPMEEGFDGMAKSFAKTLQRMAAEAAASAIMNAIFSAMSSSGNAWVSGIGTALAGARASGGPVLSGSSYLVGEKGPEVLQMGSTSGMIIPNHELGQSNGSVTVNIDAREQDDPAKILSLVPLIQGQIEQSIAMKTRRGYQ